jgi:hypothetical protein
MYLFWDLIHVIKLFSMTQSFTPEDCIRLIYRETSASETLAMHAAIADDYALREEFRGLFHAFQQLPKVTFRPSDSAIQNVLSYSKSNAFQKHV